MNESCKAIATFNGILRSTYLKVIYFEYHYFNIFTPTFQMFWNKKRRKGEHPLNSYFSVHFLAILQLANELN